MSTKALFPCGGGSNLILGTGTENQIFILRSPAAIKFFHQILQKMTLWCKKKKIITHPDEFVKPTYCPPTLFSRGIIIFQGVLTKFHFSTKFPHPEKLSI